MNTTNTTPLSAEELAALQRVCQQAQELRATYDCERHDPSEEFSRLSREAKAEVSTISSRHEKEMADLKRRHQEEVSAAWKKTEARRHELEKALQTAEEGYMRKRGSLRLQVYDWVQRATFAELVSTLPEAVRPNLIPVPDLNMFLLQLKAAPTCALIVQAKAGGSTEWGAQVATHIASKDHRLVCFCSHGCMDDVTHARVQDAICALCAERGITNVFGRKVGGTHKDIEFHDGEYFEHVMDTLGVSQDGQYVWIC